MTASDEHAPNISISRNIDLMSLRWKEFERPLAARLKVYDPRRDMGLWQRIRHGYLSNQAINSKPAIGPHPFWHILRGLVSACFIAALLSFRTDNQFKLAPWESPNIAITVIGAWSLILALFRAGFISLVANSPEHRLFRSLPVRSEDAFWRLVVEFRNGAFCLLLETLFAFGCVAWHRGLSLLDVGCALLCAALSCALSLAISLLLLRYRARLNLTLLGITTQVWLTIGSLLRMQSNDMPTGSRWFSLLNPAGWIGESYFAEGELWVWPFTAASLALIATLPFSFKAIRDSYRRDELRRNAPLAPIVSARDARRELLGSDFLNPSPWNDQGSIEKSLSAILSGHELSIAKALIVNPRAWRRKLDLFFVCVAVCAVGHAVAAKMARTQSTVRSSLIAGIALFIMLMISAGRLFGSSNQIIGHSYLPVRAFSIWKTMLKVNALLFWPLFLISLTIPWSPVAIVLSTAQSDFITPLAKAVELIAFLLILPYWLVPAATAQSTPTYRGNWHVQTHGLSIGFFIFLGQLSTAYLFSLSAAGSFLPRPVGPPFFFLHLAIPVSIALTFYMDRLEIAKRRKAAIHR